jgi:hypothetical protein
VIVGPSSRRTVEDTVIVEDCDRRNQAERPGLVHDQPALKRRRSVGCRVRHGPLHITRRLEQHLLAGQRTADDERAWRRLPLERTQRAGRIGPHEAEIRAPLEGDRARVPLDNESRSIVNDRDALRHHRIATRQSLFDAERGYDGGSIIAG